MSLATYSTIIGITELLIGVPLLVKPDETAKWLKGFLKDDLHMRMIGGIFLVLSVLVLKDNPTVGTDVAGVMRLVAWLTAIKSLVYCWLPSSIEELKEWWFGSPNLRLLSGFLATLIGVLFLMAGNALS